MRKDKNHDDKAVNFPHRHLKEKPQVEPPVDQAAVAKEIEPQVDEKAVDKMIEDKNNYGKKRGS